MDDNIMIVGLLAVVGVVILVPLVWFVAAYNGLVTLDNNVEASWAQVQNQYQRRADLIPNLVNTVKGYAGHESGTFEEVTRYRSQWGDAMKSGNRDAQIEAARGMDGALARLISISENYPNLKADQSFISLQGQLTETENKIVEERARYNEAVREYNTRIQKLPDTVVASSFGYAKKPYFEAEEGKTKVPEVTF
jgi:LemA protein